jgi:uncharacterized protein
LPFFSHPEFQLFGRVAISIVLEASPFLLIGAFLSVLLERYATADRLARWVPARPAAQIAAGLVGGMVLPVCECGVVPIARRLIDKGVSAHTVITYMLAAPVINPVVLISTYVAFGGDLALVLGRTAIVGVTAALSGWLLGRGRPQDLLNRGPRSIPATTADHGAAPCCHHPGEFEPAWTDRWVALDVMRRTALEFMDMGKYLIAGALAAAAFKVLLPWQLIQVFAGSLPAAVGLLMALAVLLSVCSEADAFVAASLVYFPSAAQLAFMSIGPMVDLKLIGMYFFTFQKRPALFLVAIPILCVYALSILASPVLR